MEETIKQALDEILEGHRIRTKKQAEQFLDVFYEFEIARWGHNPVCVKDFGTHAVVRYLIEDMKRGLMRCNRARAVEYVMECRAEINDWLYNEETRWKLSENTEMKTE